MKINNRQFPIKLSVISEESERGYYTDEEGKCMSNSSKNSKGAHYRNLSDFNHEKI